MWVDKMRCPKKGSGQRSQHKTEGWEHVAETGAEEGGYLLRQLYTVYLRVV